MKFDEQENGRPFVEEEESVQRPLILNPINETKDGESSSIEELPTVEADHPPLKPSLGDPPEIGDQWTTMVHT